MLSLLIFLSCAPKAAPLPIEAAPAPPPPPAYATDMLDAMDTSVNPCEDFYAYACGGWLAKTQLPADKPIWSRSFSAIRDQNLASERKILEDAVANTSPTPDQARIGAFYGACMNEEQANTLALTPIQPMLAEIAAIKDLKGFAKVSGSLSARSVNALAGAWVDGDFKDPTTSILYMSQSGLSLPDRDYYLNTDEKSKATLVKLEETIAGHLTRAGVKDAAKLAPKVVELEKQLAGASVARADLRDPNKTYHKIDRAGLMKTSPDLHWDLWLDAAGGVGVTAISVETPDVFKKFNTIIKKTPITVLKAWLSFSAIHNFSRQLDTTTSAADFDLFGRTLSGQKEPEVRWKQCVRATDNALGQVVGRVWVEGNFPGDSKSIALNTISEIEQAFEKGLPGLAWMDDATRVAAVAKVHAITNKVGYPDNWRSYDTLKVQSNTYFENVIAANRFENDRQFAKVAKPVDRAEWLMNPPAVNAYYNATLNEIVFPAGILQPPFFKREWPAALNYGAIGMVMGHELTHGFDDEGRKFDPEGRLKEWWSPEVTARYEERAACVQKQYDGYEIQPGLNVNGALTLGENIADLGGLALSYRAFHAHTDLPPANIPGLSEDQAFFVAFAQGWCNVISPEFSKVLALSDPHSPGRYRVNGPASDTPAFAQAFNCAEGSKMRPVGACEVW